MDTGHSRESCCQSEREFVDVTAPIEQSTAELIIVSASGKELIVLYDPVPPCIIIRITPYSVLHICVFCFIIPCLSIHRKMRSGISLE